MFTVVYDTETTGLPLKKELVNGELVTPRSIDPRQPRIIEFSAVKMDAERNEVARICTLIKPDGWDMPKEIIKFNERNNTGITMERLENEGRPIAEVMDEFFAMIEDADTIVAHNSWFDMRMVSIELVRLNNELASRHEDWKVDNRHFCTYKESGEACLVPLKTKPGFKCLSLKDLHAHLFGEQHPDQHTAIGDVLATLACFYKMQDMRGTRPAVAPPPPAGALQTKNVWPEEKKAKPNLNDIDVGF